jgi:hypothetical protein
MLKAAPQPPSCVKTERINGRPESSNEKTPLTAAALDILPPSLANSSGVLRSIFFGTNMKTPMQRFRESQEKGAIGYILMWALGVPVSLLLVIFPLRGCT